MQRERTKVGIGERSLQKDAKGRDISGYWRKKFVMSEEEENEISIHQFQVKFAMDYVRLVLLI